MARFITSSQAERQVVPSLHDRVASAVESSRGTGAEFEASFLLCVERSTPGVIKTLSEREDSVTFELPLIDMILTDVT